MLIKYNQTYWKRVFFLDYFFLKILRYNRFKIHSIFKDKIKFIKKKKILDVGTTPVFDENNNIILHRFKNLGGITSLSNLDCAPLKKYFNKVRFVQGDARRMKFKEKKFDTVYSSATIEHVGSRSNQIKFVKEVIKAEGDKIRNAL
jgi:hypothetical protein